MEHPTDPEERGVLVVEEAKATGVGVVVAKVSIAEGDGTNINLFSSQTMSPLLNIYIYTRGYTYIGVTPTSGNKITINKVIPNNPNKSEIKPYTTSRTCGMHLIKKAKSFYLFKKDSPSKSRTSMQQPHSEDDSPPNLLCTDNFPEPLLKRHKSLLDIGSMLNSTSITTRTEQMAEIDKLQNLVDGMLHESKIEPISIPMGNYIFALPP